MLDKRKYCPYCQRETVHRIDPVTDSPKCNVCDYQAQRKGVRIIVLFAIIFFTVMLSLVSMCSCSVKPPKSFTVSYDTCPTYPSVKHYRKHSKKINPKYCNIY